MSYPSVSVTLCVPLMLGVEGTWFNLLQATAIEAERSDGKVRIEFPVPLPAHTGSTTRSYLLCGQAAEAVREWLTTHTHQRLLYALPPDVPPPPHHATTDS